MTKQRWIALGLSVIGATVCLVALIGFIQMMVNNGLPWEGTSQHTRDHYLAVGSSYSQGFTVGFFLCFFLSVIAFNVGSWYESSRATRRHAVGAPANQPAGN